jgi:hypothetical protein
MQAIWVILIAGVGAYLFLMRPVPRAQEVLPRASSTLA